MCSNALYICSKFSPRNKVSPSEHFCLYQFTRNANTIGKNTAAVFLIHLHLTSRTVITRSVIRFNSFDAFIKILKLVWQELFNKSLFKSKTPSSDLDRVSGVLLNCNRERTPYFTSVLKTSKGSVHARSRVSLRNHGNHCLPNTCHGSGQEGYCGSLIL